MNILGIWQRNAGKVFGNQALRCIIYWIKGWIE